MPTQSHAILQKQSQTQAVDSRVMLLLQDITVESDEYPAIPRDRADLVMAVDGHACSECLTSLLTAQVKGVRTVVEKSRLHKASHIF